MHNWGSFPYARESGYPPHKKNVQLGLFFRTKQCTHIHRLGEQTQAKFEKGVFLAMFVNTLKEHNRQMKGKNAKLYI